jgi:hypothetical protein
MSTTGVSAAQIRRSCTRSAAVGVVSSDRQLVLLSAGLLACQLAAVHCGSGWRCGDGREAAGHTGTEAGGSYYPVRDRLGAATRAPAPKPQSALRPLGEGAGDCGCAARYLEPFVDVLQVGAHGSLGYAEPTSDLGIRVPGGDQAQQLPMPGRQPRDGAAAALGVQVGLVQVGAQQCQQRAVTLGNPGQARG